MLEQALIPRSMLPLGLGGMRARGSVQAEAKNLIAALSAGFAFRVTPRDGHAGHAGIIRGPLKTDPDRVLIQRARPLRSKWADVYGVVSKYFCEPLAPPQVATTKALPDCCRRAVEAVVMAGMEALDGSAKP